MHQSWFFTLTNWSTLIKLVHSVKRLNELGARKIVVVDVGPLGCIPYVRALQVIPNGKCSSVANKLIRAYNAKLRQRIYQLNQEMGPETTFVYANSFDIVMQVLRNYSRYGTLPSLLYFPLLFILFYFCESRGFVFSQYLFLIYFLLNI